MGLSRPWPLYVHPKETSKARPGPGGSRDSQLPQKLLALVQNLEFSEGFYVESKMVGFISLNITVASRQRVVFSG